MSCCIMNPPKMLSVASAFPPDAYTQEEMRSLLGVGNPVVHRLLSAQHIRQRHLMLPTVSLSSSDAVNTCTCTCSAVAQCASCASDRSRSTAHTMSSDMSGSCGVSVSTESLATPHPHASPSSSSSSSLMVFPQESRRELHLRHVKGLCTFGVEAARRALAAAGVDGSNIGQVAVVVAVTSTGLAMPGFSAILMRELGLASNTLRTDVVGMGCNAGVSGLRTLSMMLSGVGGGGAINNTGAMAAQRFGLLVCCETCSAVYVRDDTTATGIVNSLFGDGAVATVLRVGQDGGAPPSLPSSLPPRTNVTGEAVNGTHKQQQQQQEQQPIPSSIATTPCSTGGRLKGSGWDGISLVDFESATLAEYFDDMVFDVSEAHDRLRFLLSQRIPFAIGDNVATPVMALLHRHGLQPSDVSHWAVHTGGAAVIEGVTKNLGLPMDALRHTTSVLRDHGNISSGSFLVSLERLLAEHRSHHEDEHVSTYTSRSCIDETRKEEPLNTTTTTTTTPTLLSAGGYVGFIAMGPGATIEVGLGILQ